MQEYYLITFESTHAAIATEKLLKPAGVSIMPVPRFISASCGIAVRIHPEKRVQAEKLFESGSVLKSNEYAYYHICPSDGKSDSVDGIECERISMSY